MSLYNGPPRGGSRGGKDQFSWEQVRSDKDREYYLGHSVKALTGRWQKGKDVYWYTRDKQGQDDSAHQDELRAVKEREEQLMAEALGLKPKAMAASKRRLDSEDMTKLLGRTTNADAASDDEGSADEPHKGLGHGPMALGGVSAVSRLDGYDELHDRDRRRQASPSDAGGRSAAPSSRHDVQFGDKRGRSHRSPSPPIKRRPSSHDASPSRSRKKHKSDKKHKKEKHRKHKKEKHKKHRHSERERSP